MKLIIDIPEDRYKDVIESQKHHLLDSYAQAVANGTPIPDNVTNRDVLKMIFPKIGVYDEWYDEPYQKGGKDEVN